MALPEGFIPDELVPEGFVPDAPEAPAPPPQDRNATLKAINEAALQEGPAGHAAALDISRKTGLPVDIVKSNLKDFQVKVKAAEFDPQKFREQNPELAKLVEAHPQTAPVVMNDPALFSLEWFMRGGPFRGITEVPAGSVQKYGIGNLNMEVAAIARKQRAHTATPEDLARADALEQQIAATKVPSFGFVAGMIPEAAEQIPRQIKSIPRTLNYTAVGAAAGIPGGPLGVLGGAGLGLSVGVAHVVGAEEGDLFYRKAIQEGIDPKLAEWGATVVGVANGALEAAPLDKVLRVVPGAKALLQGPTKDIVARFIKAPGLKGALLRSSARMAEGMIFEGLTEGLQEVVSSGALGAVGGITAKPSEAVQAGALGAVAGIKKAWESGEIQTSIVKGAQGAGGMHILSPGVWVETGTEIAHARRAQQVEATFKALGEVVKESSTFAEMPDHAKAYSKALRQKYGTLPETVAVPAGKLDALLQAGKVDAEKALPDVVRQLAQATHTDDEVTVRTDDLLAHVAPLQGFDGLTADIRVGDGPTAREVASLDEGEVTITAQEMQSKEAQGEAQAPVERDDFEITVEDSAHFIPLENAPPKRGKDESGLMSDAEYAKYTKIHNEAFNEAKAQADRARTREWMRGISEEADEIRAKLEVEAQTDRALNIRSAFKTGAYLNGERAPLWMQDAKLDLDWVRENVDEGLLGELRGITKKGGLDPEVVARTHRFKDGQEMLWALAEKPSKEAWIRRETNKQLAEKYPGYTGSRSWAKENVDRALHIDAVGNAIWAGYVALNKKVGNVVKTTAKLVLQKAAERGVQDTPIWGLNLKKIDREQGRAALEAAEAWRKRDVPAANDAVRRQMYHHYAWRATDAALDRASAFREYARSFDGEGRRKRVAQGGLHYLELIDAIRHQLGLRKTGASQPLDTLIQAVVADGKVPPLDAQAILSLPGDWKDMTVRQLDTVQTALEALHGLGKTAGDIAEGEKRAALAAASQELGAHIAENRPPRGPPPTSGPPSEGGQRPGNLPPENPSWVGKTARMADWHLRKIEFMTRILDGGKTAGLAFKRIFKPFVDAEVNEVAKVRDLVKQLKEIFPVLTLKDRFAFDRTVPFLTETMRRRDLLMVALNLRNEGNMQRMLDSKGWQYDEVIARLDKLLTEEDVALVNKLGDLVESYWPEVRKVYQDHHGVPPKGVTGKGVVLSEGKVIKGGYFPIIKNWDKIARLPANQDELWDSGFNPIDVGHGFTEERAAKNVDPLLLDIDALPRHLMKVIHYITHYNAVRDVDRLTRSAPVQDAIIKGVSKEAYDEIRPWLRAIARDSNQGEDAVGIFEKTMRHLRTGSSIVMLYGKSSVAVKQLLGLTSARKELGAKHFRYGVRAFLSSIGQWPTTGVSPFAAVAQRDPAFDVILRSYDREVYDVYRSATSALSSLGTARHAVVSMGMALFNLFQGTVNAITWHGAYQKALDEGHADPTAYANSTVRLSQSSSGVKDLAAIQRGSEWKKMVTVMYGYFSDLYNQLAESATGQPIDRSVASKLWHFAAHYWWLVLLPSALSVWVSGEADDDEPKELAKRLGMESALYTARTIPGVDQMTAAFLEGREARVAPWVGTAVALAKVAGRVASDKELTDRNTKELSDGAGMLLHLPTAGGLNAWTFMEKYANDELEEPVPDLLFRSPGQMR